VTVFISSTPNPSSQEEGKTADVNSSQEEGKPADVNSSQEEGKTAD